MQQMRFLKLKPFHRQAFDVDVADIELVLPQIRFD